MIGSRVQGLLVSVNPITLVPYVPSLPAPSGYVAPNTTICRCSLIESGTLIAPSGSLDPRKLYQKTRKRPAMLNLYSPSLRAANACGI